MASETSHALSLPLGVKHVYGQLILSAQPAPAPRASMCFQVTGKSTARGFEPLRAEPNGFRVHLLNRSDTLSCHSVKNSFFSLSERGLWPALCYQAGKKRNSISSCACAPAARQTLVGSMRLESEGRCKVDTLGIEPRASRMLSGCDTTTPCAPSLRATGFATCALHKRKPRLPQ